MTEMLAASTRRAIAPVVPFADLPAMHRDVEAALESAWREVTTTSSFIGGELVERFEHEWAAYCGVEHAVGVANGTDALALVLRALGIGLGDEVIVPTNTFIATAEAVILSGATPRFVDVDAETLLMTPALTEAAITPRTAAVIVVHLYGSMPAMAGFERLAATRGLALIEDAAQAHGSTDAGRRAGSVGAAGCFSFYPGKNLGAFGDAGAVVTNDRSLADAVRSMSNHGRSAQSGYVHQMIGINSRLDALQAAVLSAKLTMLDRWNHRRRDAMATYRAQLPGGVRPIRATDGSTYHVNVVAVPDRDFVRDGLEERGVGTGIHYPVPCHLQEPYRAFHREPLPVAERAAAEILSLPLFPHMTGEDVRFVCSALADVLERHQR